MTNWKDSLTARKDEQQGCMLKLADGADSKSVAEMRVGSNPTTPTTNRIDD